MLPSLTPFPIKAKSNDSSTSLVSEINNLQTTTNPDIINTSPLNEDILAAAKDFEAAFISQMLTFSGLADALTLGGGEDVSAFTSFYIESFAEKIADNGGFGLADNFYNKLLKQVQLSEMEKDNVDLGRL